MSNDVKSVYSEWLAEAISPIKAYFTILKKISVSSEIPTTVQEIKDGRIDVKLLVSGLIGGWILSTLIDFFIGQEGLPDLIMLPILMIAYLFSAVLVYPGLKRLGGKGNFNQTFIATLIASAAVPPMVSLMAAFGVSNEVCAYAGTAFVFPVLSQVHGLSYMRTAAGAYIVIFVASVVLLLMIAIW